jgi:lysophospholipase L1-like esterase
MKTVLAFGDSLTWGAIPGSDQRHGFSDRWPNVLERELGNGVRVIENGVNGRTTVLDDPFSPLRNGAQHLPGLLEAHSPLDLVIIMLGTNDLNYCYGGRAAEAMWGMNRLVEIVEHHPYPRTTSAPQVVLMAPPHLREATGEPDYVDYFAASIEESKKLTAVYGRIAAERGCHSFDAASVAVASEIDGCHLDAENTRAIGLALVPLVRKTLGL